MQRVTTLFVATALLFGGRVARAGSDAKATELLAQARSALGGEKALARVRALSCSGTIQRLAGDRQIAGELTLDLELPDRMLRTESISPMGDSAVVVNEQGINGDVLLRGMRTLNAPPGMFIRTPPPPAPGSEAEVQALRNARAELARLALALLLAPQSSAAIELAYGGEAESPDGKADVLDAKGAGSFAAKLFLDRSSHRPLMLTYRGASPRMIVQTQRVNESARGANPPQPRRGEGRGARADDLAPPPPPEIVDITLFFDDYRSVDGVLLPHHISRSVDGQTIEEWTFKTIKANPTFKPDTFSKK